MAEQKTKLSHRLFADFLLLLITAIWGSTFVMVDRAVDVLGVFTFLPLRTGPGKTAFIIGLYVVLVPIFAAILLKKAPHKLSWIAIFVVVVGLGLLSIESLDMQASDLLGDFFIIIGTFGYAFHIITIDRFVQKEHYSTLAVIQIGTVMILSWIFSGIFWNSRA